MEGIVFIAYSVTMHYGDPELIMVGSSIDVIVDTIKEEKEDLVKMVEKNEGHIIIDEVTVDEIDSDARRFDTGFDEAWEQLVGKDRYPEEV